VLALLVAANWFQEIAVTFGLEYHGGCLIDLLFGVLKVMLRLRTIYSLDQIRRTIARTKHKDIDLHELTAILNHASS